MTDNLGDVLKWLESVDKLVNAQAEDYGLWFNAQTVTEAYLQQALRELHKVIEGET